MTERTRSGLWLAALGISGLGATLFGRWNREAEAKDNHTSNREDNVHYTTRRMRVQLFGDSITQYSMNNGFGSMLAHAYQRRADVVVRGYSGYNTRWALTLLEHSIRHHSWGNPHLVTVFFGANDCAMEGKSTQHVPLDEFKGNLRKIVALLQQQGFQETDNVTAGSGAITKALSSGPWQSRTHVVLIAPGAIDDDAWEVHCAESNPPKPKNRRDSDAAKYARAVVEVGKELNLPVVNTYEAMHRHAHWKELLNDGLHLSDAGNEVVFQAMEAVIKQHYPHLAPSCDDILFDWPLWDQIDPKQYKESF